MEIYRQTENIVSFQPPAGSTGLTATASLNDGDAILLTPTAETLNSPVRRYILPYLNDEGTVRINWSFYTSTFSGNEEVTVTETYDVVTRILSDVEIREVHPAATKDEIIRIERAVRHIINAHTGQRFGRFVGEKSIRGNGTRALYLPERLLSLSKVNGHVPGRFYSVDGDGYILRHFPWGIPPVKADAHGLHMHTGGVIHNPNNVSMGRWEDSRYFKVAGTWGWEQVPQQVKEAAKLLVNDYACADIAYRDRYLTSMTAADWRVSFNSGAFTNTGNVRSDQLLASYVLTRGWAVV